MSVHAIDTDVVTRVAGRHLGTIEVRDLVRLSGGASRETWAFDASGADGTTFELILRRDPPGRAPAAVDECALLNEAARVGVAVPGVRFELDEDDGIGRGFVMDRIDGETLGRRIVGDEVLRGARVGFARRCGEILASVHAMDIDRAGLRMPTDPSQFVVDQIDGFEQLVDSFGVARPVLELAMRWLRAHQPALHEATVVHGDFRVGNLIVGPEGIRSVLDWELAHVGDPAEDLGWLCVRSWRFGGPGRVGGIGDVADLIEGYRAAGGRPITEADIGYWEVFGNLRWAVICLAQTFAHLNGDHRSVELAAIGRRVCEVEHDLMELLG